MKSFGKAFINVAFKQHKTKLLFNKHAPSIFNGLLNRFQVVTFVAKTVKVPEMGDSITEGTLVTWLKSK